LSKTKEMKITIKTLIESKEALSFIFNNCALPGAISYDIMLLIDEVNNHYDKHDSVKKSLMEKYGKKKGDKIVIEPSSKGYNNFIKEYEELLDKTIEIKDVKIPLAVLKNQEKIKPQYFSSLAWAIKK